MAAAKNPTLLSMDGDLEAHLADMRNKENKQNEGRNPNYPPRKIRDPAPPTEHEKLCYKYYKERMTARRRGPFYIPYDVDGTRNDGDFNAFEEAGTYSNKKRKRGLDLPDLSKVPGFHRDLMPKELWPICGLDKDETEDEAASKRNKDFSWLKRKRIGGLAGDEGGFADDADADEAAADDDADAEDRDEDGEDPDEEQVDDDFDEDDDSDANNDYNAENYFDGGDEDFDEQGGDGGGEDW